MTLGCKDGEGMNYNKQNRIEPKELDNLLAHWGKALRHKNPNNIV